MVLYLYFSSESTLCRTKKHSKINKMKNIVPPLPNFGSAARRLIGVERICGMDGHAHIFDAALQMRAQRRYTPKTSASLDDLCKNLRAHNLGGALLTQPSFLGTDNRFLLCGLQHARDSFSDLALRGVVELAPTASSAELSGLARQGIVGTRLNLFGITAPDFSTPPWPQFLRRVDRKNWHVEIYIEGVRLARPLKQLLRHCRMVVVDHFGLPQSHNPLNCPGFQSLLKAPAGRVMVKTSAPYRVFNLPSAIAAERCTVLYRALRESSGAESLLWGSDWPWTCHEEKHTYGDTVAWFRQWNA